MSDAFDIDPRLTETSFVLGDWPLCHVRLVDDQRWPWLLLIPRREGVVELFDLSETDRAALVEEAARAARIVQSLINADKTNVATLGNQVPQLHVHVIGRKIGDPAWPGPVWGVGTPTFHSPQSRKKTLEAIRREM